MLPTFRHSPAAALDVAARAASCGIDGVFAFDHIWPMGSPDRPAIAPFEVLAQVAASHPTLVVGPLVARIGLVADEVLLGQLRALRVVAAAGIVAALGTGDKKSREENLAYGIDYAAPEARRASLRAVAGALVDEGVEVWIGDGAAPTRAVAIELGCTVNLWDRDVDAVAAAARVAPVSWAGPCPSDPQGAVSTERTRALLHALDAAGASWAVFAGTPPVELIAGLRAR